MKSDFVGVEIKGVCTVLPRNEVCFDDEIENYTFTKQQTLKLKKVFSLDKRRVVEKGVCASDLAEHGLKWLKNKFPEVVSEVGAILFISQTPDYLMPPTSNILQSKLGLPEDTYCLDINQGCCGFVIGLQQASALISTSDINHVLVVNADVLSVKVSKKDRNSNPLVGDAASITLVSRTSNTNSENKLSFNIKMDGKGAFALHIPAGGARIPCAPETATMVEDGMGNLRSQDNLVMVGDQVFAFVQSAVPKLVSETMVEQGVRDEDVAKYLFHQPNKFMLQKLAEALCVNAEKIPSNIVEKYGNSSGVTIPLVITSNTREAMLAKQKLKYIICGFGVGLTWGCLIVSLGDMLFCEQLEI
jgi:3-oxoacyl-[acyl-carrier-protein] synthase III